MGRLPLIGRLIGRDLRRRPGQAGLLLLAVTAATSVLALGLVLHGVTSQPFQQTQAATRGPDVVAQLFPRQPAQGPVGPGQSGPGLPPAPSAAEVAKDEKALVAQARTLEHEPGVTASSGPYLTASGILHARGLTAGVQAEGRDPQASRVDQPVVTAGHWVSNGGVVLERTFAGALGVGVGDHVTMDGRSYLVVGIAVTATSSPFPNLCYADCAWNGGPDLASVHISQRDIGLAWVTESAAAAMTVYGKQPPTYLVNLKLKDPGQAQAFASGYQSGNSAPVAVSLTPWQTIASADGLLVLDEQQVLSPGALLAALLALASVVVLAGGRMAQQTRRIGLLKAVGAAPGLVAVVLMAENLVLALLAAAAGLTVGWLAAPLVTSPGAGLLGTPGAPSMTLPIVGEVVAVALVVAVVATLVPAIRAARTSTVDALADSARLAPARRRADRDLGAAAGAAAARAAADRPQAAPGVADRGQRRDHGHRDRGRAHLPRHRGPHDLRFGQRSGQPGGEPRRADADGAHGRAGRPGHPQRDLLDLDDDAGQPARGRAIARARRQPGTGQRRTDRGAGDSRAARGGDRRPAGHRAVQGREPRRGDERAAGLVAGRSGAGDAVCARPAQRDPGSLRHPPPRRRGPAGRVRVDPSNPSPDEGSESPAPPPVRLTARPESGWGSLAGPGAALK